MDFRTANGYTILETTKTKILKWYIPDLHFFSNSCKVSEAMEDRSSIFGHPVVATVLLGPTGGSFWFCCNPYFWHPKYPEYKHRLEIYRTAFSTFFPNNTPAACLTEKYYIKLRVFGCTWSYIRQLTESCGIVGFVVVRVLRVKALGIGRPVAMTKYLEWFTFYLRNN